MSNAYEIGEFKVVISENKDPELSDDYFVEEWTRDGVLHRPDGPAIIIRSKHDGNTYREEYYDNGIRHRDDGPAFIEGDENHLVEEWYHYDELHRENDPARLVTIPISGRILEEEWWQNTKAHREDGPAVLHYSHGQSQILLREVWCVRGEFHREDGPAEIDRDSKTGIAWIENWYFNGIRHRTDGPAQIRRDRDTGAIKQAENHIAEHNLDVVIQPEITPET